MPVAARFAIGGGFGGSGEQRGYPKRCYSRFIAEV